MEAVGVEIQFEEGNISRAYQGKMETSMEEIEGEAEKGSEEPKDRGYEMKEQQSKLYRGQEQECHVWFFQNLNPGEAAVIMTMLEQMVGTRSWKEA